MFMLKVADIKFISPWSIQIEREWDEVYFLLISETGPELREFSLLSRYGLFSDILDAGGYQEAHAKKLYLALWYSVETKIGWEIIIRNL